MCKINKDNIQDIFPLTSLQEGMLYNYIMYNEMPEYFQQLHIEVEGKLNISAFHEACKILTCQNEALRTVYRWEGLIQPIQLILKHHEVNFCYYECKNKTEFQKALQANAEHKNPLHGQVPFYIYVYKKSANNYLIHIFYHHIVMDGWSNANIFRQLFSYYHQIIQNIDPNIKNRSITRQYIDFLKNQDKQAQKKFWTAYFKNMVPVEIAKITTDISLSHDRKLESYTIEFDKELKDMALCFSKKNEITIAELLYAMWAILLSEYTNSNDILFGQVLSGRPSELTDIINAVGLFIRTLPIRIVLDNNATIIELLQSLRQNLIQTREYQYTPLSKIKKYSGIEHTKNLFQALFVIENYPIEKTLLRNEQDIQIKSFKMEESTEYPLTISVVLLDQWSILYKYNSAVFNKGFIQEMADYFFNITKRMLSDNNLTISAIKQVAKTKGDTTVLEVKKDQFQRPKYTGQYKHVVVPTFSWEGDHYYFLYNFYTGLLKTYKINLLSKNKDFFNYINKRFNVIMKSNSEIDIMPHTCIIHKDKIYVFMINMPYFLIINTKTDQLHIVEDPDKKLISSTNIIRNDHLYYARYSIDDRVHNLENKKYLDTQIVKMNINSFDVKVICDFKSSDICHSVSVSPDEKYLISITANSDPVIKFKGSEIKQSQKTLKELGKEGVYESQIHIFSTSNNKHKELPRNDTLGHIEFGYKDINTCYISAHNLTTNHLNNFTYCIGPASVLKLKLSDDSKIIETYTADDFFRMPCHKLYRKNNSDYIIANSYPQQVHIIRADTMKAEQKFHFSKDRRRASTKNGAFRLPRVDLTPFSVSACDNSDYIYTVDQKHISLFDTNKCEVIDQIEYNVDNNPISIRGHSCFQ